jgi:hypothetical protein
MSQTSVETLSQETIRSKYRKVGINSSRNIAPHPETKIKAFFREFPFANPYSPDFLGHEGKISQELSLPGVATVHVSRLTPNIIERKLIRGYHSEHVLLFNQDGEMVKTKRVVIWSFKVPIIGSTISHKKLVNVAGKVLPHQETIMDVLEDLGEKAADVKFAVSYHTWTRALILYKALPEIDLVGYKQRYLQEQKASLEECILAEQLAFKEA